MFYIRPIFISADEPIFDESVFDGPDLIEMPLYGEPKVDETTGDLEKI